MPTWSRPAWTGSIWPTSTRPTTSTPISATTTCGRRWRSATGPSTTAWPASEPTAAPARARTTPAARRGRRSRACSSALATPWIVVSVSDEGFHDPAAVAEKLGERGYVGALAIDFKRYVGAQIGIHNPAGERVGRVSHLRNTEWLFVCGPDRVRRCGGRSSRRRPPPSPAGPNSARRGTGAACSRSDPRQHAEDRAMSAMRRAAWTAGAIVVLSGLVGAAAGCAGGSGSSGSASAAARGCRSREGRAAPPARCRRSRRRRAVAGPAHSASSASDVSLTATLPGNPLGRDRDGHARPARPAWPLRPRHGRGGQDRRPVRRVREPAIVVGNARARRPPGDAGARGRGSPRRGWRSSDSAGRRTRASSAWTSPSSSSTSMPASTTCARRNGPCGASWSARRP